MQLKNRIVLAMILASALFASFSTQTNELFKELMHLGEKVSDHRNVSFSAWENFFGPPMIIGSSVGFQTACINSDNLNMSFAEQIITAVFATIGLNLFVTPLLSRLGVKYKIWRIKKTIAGIEKSVANTKSITQLEAARELLNDYCMQLLHNRSCHSDKKAADYCANIFQQIIKKIEFRTNDIREKQVMPCRIYN